MNKYWTFRVYPVQEQIEIWKEEVASKLTTSRLTKMIRELRKN